MNANRHKKQNNLLPPSMSKTLKNKTLYLTDCDINAKLGKVSLTMTLKKGKNSNYIETKMVYSSSIVSRALN